MLTLDKFKRMTARDLLKHKIFQNIGDSTHIIDCSHQISVKFDYSTGNDPEANQNNKDLNPSLVDLQKMIQREAKKIRKMHKC